MPVYFLGFGPDDKLDQFEGLVHVFGSEVSEDTATAPPTVPNSVNGFYELEMGGRYQRALERARKEDIQVISHQVFELQGFRRTTSRVLASDGASQYVVRTEISAEYTLVACSCHAGKHQNLCKHVVTVVDMILHPLQEESGDEN